MAKCICGHKDSEHGEMAEVCDSECSSCDCERFVVSNEKPSSVRRSYEVLFRRDVRQVVNIVIRASSKADALKGARAELDARGGWQVEKTIGCARPTIRTRRE
jgi:hypothetical protein